MNNKNKSSGCVGWMIVVIIILMIGCMSCVKESSIKLNEYTMIIDWHSLDTTILYQRYTQELGVLRKEEAIKIDTAKDMWYITCENRDTLNHLYYKRNGIKIQK